MKSLQIPFLTLKTLCWFSFCCCRDGQCNVFLKNCPYILVTKVNRILKDSWACYIYFRTYFFVNILPNCLFCWIFCRISDGAGVWASAGARDSCTTSTSLSHHNHYQCLQYNKMALILYCIRGGGKISEVGVFLVIWKHI